MKKRFVSNLDTFIWCLQNVLHVRSEFKDIYKTLGLMTRHMKSFYDQAVIFSDQLQKFSFRTDEDDSGDSIMQVCGSQFIRLAQIQLAMVRSPYEIHDNGALTMRHKVCEAQGPPKDENPKHPF